MGEETKYHDLQHTTSQGKLVPVHARKADGGVEVQRNSFLTLVLDRSEYSHHAPVDLFPENNAGTF